MGYVQKMNMPSALWALGLVRVMRYALCASRSRCRVEVEVKGERERGIQFPGNSVTRRGALRASASRFTLPHAYHITPTHAAGATSNQPAAPPPRIWHFSAHLALGIGVCTRASPAVFPAAIIGDEQQHHPLGCDEHCYVGAPWRLKHASCWNLSTSSPTDVHPGRISLANNSSMCASCSSCRCCRCCCCCGGGGCSSSCANAFRLISRYGAKRVSSGGFHECRHGIDTSTFSGMELWGCRS